MGARLQEKDAQVRTLQRSINGGEGDASCLNDSNSTQGDKDDVHKLKNDLIQREKQLQEAQDVARQYEEELQALKKYVASEVSQEKVVSSGAYQDTTFGQQHKDEIAAENKSSDSKRSVSLERNDADKLQCELAMRMEDVERMQGLLRQRDVELSALNITSAADQGEIRRLQDEVANASQRMHNLEDTVQQREAELRPLQHRFSSSYMNIQSIQADLAVRDSELQMCQGKLASKDAQVRALEESLAEKDGMLRSIDATLSGKEVQVYDLRQALQAQEVEQAVLRQDIGKRETEVRILLQEVNKKDSEIFSLHQTMSALEKDVTTIRNERDASLRAVEQSSDFYQKELDAVRAENEVQLCALQQALDNERGRSRDLVTQLMANEAESCAKSLASLQQVHLCVRVW
jgi:chromosome segregation ATPase